jgi:membrane-bound serine protease (ClpP class)
MKTKFKHIWLFILFLTLGSSIAEETKKNIYVIPIQDTIDLGIPAFVNRAISAAEKNSAELIIFDIDTFGGRVDAATQIKDAISEQFQQAL